KKISELIPEFMLKDYRKAESKYGKITETAKTIVKALTGRRPGKEITVDITDELEDGVMGTNDPTSHEIQARPRSYLKTIATLFHEYGHEFYKLDANQVHTEMVKRMEEAAAYCFMISGLMRFADIFPHTKEMVDNYIIDYRNSELERFNEKDDDSHPTGWALAEAIAKNHGGDFAQAFNYLATVQSWEEIAPWIRADYEEMKRFKPPELESPTGDIRITLWTDEVIDAPRKILETYWTRGGNDNRSMGLLASREM
ncbi:hypothetical protein ACFL0V_03590, partial [Nanoarchaeota archaeon]